MERIRSMQIYYFSGTGNTLHLAQELQKRFPEAELISIVSAMRSGQLKSTADTIGLLFPIYNFSLPPVYKHFLEQVDLSSAEYIFALSSRFCLERVFNDLDKHLACQGKALNAAFSVEMPCNYIPMFDVPLQEEIDRMESDIRKKMDEIQATITNRETALQKDELPLKIVGGILYPVVSTYMGKIRLPNMTKSFYVDDTCTGCGICQNICLTERITLVDGRPQWNTDADCFMCFACLCYCPEEAIQLKGRKTEGKPRYHHANIKAGAIASQKNPQ